MSVNICFMYLVLQHWLHRYLQLFYPLTRLTPLSLCGTLLCLLSQSLFKVYFVWWKFCFLSFFPLAFALNSFTVPSLSVYKSFSWKWVCCRQRMDGSSVFIRSVILCVLMRVFRPFTFKLTVCVHFLAFCYLFSGCCCSFSFLVSHGFFSIMLGSFLYLL